MNIQWNSELYDKKHDFVAEYGKGLLELLPKDPAQSVLDLGCGTGTLTAELAKRYTQVLGVDASREMIERAQAQFPSLRFEVMDALELPFDGAWDIIFSNAVFHWIDDHDLLVRSIRKALKPGGLLVCEFGGAGNIETIRGSFRAECEARGVKFVGRGGNFGSAEGFGELLRKHGFAVERIYEFDRPTSLKDGEKGLENWMRQFFAEDMNKLSAEAQEEVCRAVEERTRELLWNGKEWTADYRRLRVIARAE